MKVKFSPNVWVKRYLDSKKWVDIREDEIISDMKKYFPHDWERMIYNMKYGKMSFKTKYAEYMFLEDSVYSDEIPVYD